MSLEVFCVHSRLLEMSAPGKGILLLPKALEVSVLAKGILRPPKAPEVSAPIKCVMRTLEAFRGIRTH